MGDAAIRLAVVQGSDVGREVVVDRELVAGRAANVDVVLNDARVSSRHATLRPAGDAVEVTDLGSTNGTFLNEQRITTPHMVRAGDQLRLGGTVFSLQTSPAQAPAPTPPAPEEKARALWAETPPGQNPPVPPQPVPPAPVSAQPAAPVAPQWPPAEPVGARPAGAPPTPGPTDADHVWRLTVRTGPDAGRRLEIANGATEMIGRGVGSGLSLNDPRVSSRHAQVRNMGGTLTVEDLDSANGTLINGKRLKGRSGPLKEGAEVQVGESVLITGRGPSGQSRFGPTPTIVGQVPTEESTGRRLLPIGLAVAALVIAAIVLVVVLTPSHPKKPLTTAQVIARESPSMVEVLSHQDGQLDALGSGFAIDAAKGLIVTNNHVATGGSLTVQPQAKRSIQGAAKIVGTLPCQDIALIQVSDSAVKKVLTNSTLDKTVPSPGDSVVAMGYPTSAGSGAKFSSETLSSTSGIVSKSHTQYDYPPSGEALLPSVVQHTAAINPGNSGGPLLNIANAKVVGMDTATFDTDEDQRAEGENYAISSTQILKELPLLKSGDFSQWVGLSFDGSITNNAGNPIALGIDGVTPGTALAKDDIGAEDALLSVNGQATPTMQAYCREMPRTAGATATMTFAISDGSSNYFKDTLTVPVGVG